MKKYDKRKCLFVQNLQVQAGRLNSCSTDAVCIVYVQVMQSHAKSCKVTQSHAKSCNVLPGASASASMAGLCTVSPGRPKLPPTMTGVAPPHLAAPASADPNILAPRLQPAHSSRFIWSPNPTCKVWVGDLPMSYEGARDCLCEALPTNGPARWQAKPGVWGYYWAVLTFECTATAINAFDRLLRYRMRNGRHLQVRYLAN